MELAGEYLAEAVVRGIRVTDQRSGITNEYGGKTHIKYRELGKIVTVLGLMKPKYSTKHFMTVCIIGTEDKRIGSGILGYKILVWKTDAAFLA